MTNYELLIEGASASGPPPTPLRIPTASSLGMRLTGNQIRLFLLNLFAFGVFH